MADGTRRSYVRSVAGFSAFHGRSPDELTLEDVRDYQLHLVARGLKASSICPIMSALRFLYAVTLDRPRAGGPHPAAAQGRPPARHPLPGRGRAPAGRRRRPVDAGAADHGLRRRPARLRGRGAPGRPTSTAPRMTIRVREGKGGARPLRHALAAAARDPARPLAPHPLAPLAVPGAGPVPADHGAHGAARLPRGGRGRRARQVGHRAHPAALLRHPPARAGRRHPGDPGPAGPPADRLDHALRPGRAAAPSARSRARSSCSTWGRRRRPEPAA